MPAPVHGDRMPRLHEWCWCTHQSLPRVECWGQSSRPGAHTDVEADCGTAQAKGGGKSHSIAEKASFLKGAFRSCRSRRCRKATADAGNPRAKAWKQQPPGLCAEGGRAATSRGSDELGESSGKASS